MLKTVIAALLVAAQSSSPPPPGAPPPPVPPIPPGRGEIVLFREVDPAIGGATCPVFYGDTRLVDLQAGKWTRWAVSPGRYPLTSGNTRLAVRVDLGASHYVRCEVTKGHGNVTKLRAVSRRAYERQYALWPQPMLNDVETMPHAK